jgi:Trp operon repressor
MMQYMGGKLSPKALAPQKRDNLQNEILRTLYAIIKKKNADLFLDLLTESEQIMVARRILIAKRLVAGENQQKIRFDLEVGQGTIEGVERWLQGHFAEYKTVIPTLYQEMKQQARDNKKNTPPSASGYLIKVLRKKYPLHSLIFDLIMDEIDLDAHKLQNKSVQSYVPVKKKRMVTG